MDEAIELPLNKETYIHSNVSRASLFSIITSPEYTGELNAIISELLLISGENCLDGLSHNAFTNYFESIWMDMDKTKRVLKFYSHPYSEQKYAYLSSKIDIKKKL